MNFDLQGIVPADTGHIPAGIHPTANIGGPPEMRTWREGHRVLAPYVHPTARVSAFCSVDGGLYGATKLGKNSWMLQHSHLGHDACVQMDVEISTGAVIGGHCILLDGCRIGLNATVLPHRVIGRGALVGAGSVVTKDIPDGDVWAGNPARPLAKQDPDRKVIVGGVETTVGELRSRHHRCADAGDVALAQERAERHWSVVGDGKHPKAGTRAKLIDEHRHPVGAGHAFA